MQENKEKKGGLGFTANFENINNYIPHKNPSYKSSFNDINNESINSIRSIMFEYSAPFHFPNEISFESQYENIFFRPMIKSKNNFPLPFVSYQGEHKNYQKLYENDPSNVFGLSSLSFSIPRVLFDFFGGFSFSLFIIIFIFIINYNYNIFIIIFIIINLYYYLNKKLKTIIIIINIK